MTKKGMLILKGDSTAKNIFQEKLKKDYWIWNVSTLNHLRHNATALGWEFTNDALADEFIQKLLDLSNEYLQYEYNYILKFMDKIMSSKKAEENNKLGDLLIVHVNKELSDRLQNEFMFYVVNVTMGNLVPDNFENGRFVLGMGDIPSDVDKAIESVMSIICTDNNKQQGE
jgi:hypothetical protein